MARPIAADRPENVRTLAAVAELATDVAGERMRREEAARIVVLARRVAKAAPTEPSDAASRAVAEIARHWDPSIMTALEYAEMLPPVVVDRLLRAAPGWAAAVSAPAYLRAA